MKSEPHGEEPKASLYILLEGISFIVLVVLGTFFIAIVIGYYTRSLLGTSVLPNLGLFGYVAGLILAAIGVAFIGWVLKYRKLKDVLESSVLTVHKFIHRLSLEDRLGRTEQFTPKGPHRYTRNPLYFAVVSITIGLGLLLSDAIFLIWGTIQAAWFLVVLIPFEESELASLFGDVYKDYRMQVPVLIPYGRRYTGRKTSLPSSGNLISEL